MSGNKRVFTLLVAALLLSSLVAVPFAQAQEGPPQVGLNLYAEGYSLHGPYWVGTMEFVVDPGSERPIPLSVWYPALNAEGAEEAVTYEYQAKWVPGPEFTPTVLGHALRNGAPDLSAAPYPVLVLSPGFGTSPASYSNLAEHVASYGFIVLAPDHMEGVYLMEETIEGFFKDLPVSTVENPRDITRVLDYAQTLAAAGGELAGVTDLEHVAVAGHSSGGYTALAAGGARMDLGAMNARCADARAQGDPTAEEVCDPLEPFAADMAALAGLDAIPDGLWPNWGDIRVDAVIPMAGDSYMFGEAGLAEVTVPLMAMVGTADAVDWTAQPTFEYASSRQKALVLFENGGHGIFANSCASSPWLVDIGLGWQCADPVWDRLRSNDLVNYFVTAFLLTTLKGDAEAAAALAPDAVQFPGIEYQAVGF